MSRSPSTSKGDSSVQFFTNQNQPIFKSWGGSCSGSNPVCTFPLTGDNTVTGNWSYF